MSSSRIECRYEGVDSAHNGKTRWVHPKSGAVFATPDGHQRCNTGYFLNTCGTYFRCGDYILRPVDKDFGKITATECVNRMAELYPQYHKPVPQVATIDTYVVNQLFPVDDPTGCILHARKKLLIPGVRSGGKGMRKDITEARDALTRWLELNPEQE